MDNSEATTNNRPASRTLGAREQAVQQSGKYVLWTHPRRVLASGIPYGREERAQRTPRHMHGHLFGASVGGVWVDLVLEYICTRERVEVSTYVQRLLC
jgi:hypothetical protein